MDTAKLEPVVIQDLVEIGRDLGLEQGRAEGVEQGRAEGVEQGRAEGVEQGRAEGVEQGRAEGVEQGRAEGVEQGRAEGVEAVRETLLETIAACGVVLDASQHERIRAERSLQVLRKWHCAALQSSTPLSLDD
jgi:flagellar biosynthesis/type III secretory pathway protein FliH